jgi:hypothetical protein
MKFAARLLTLLAVFSFLAGCQHRPRTGVGNARMASEPLAPSPRLIVGRIIATDNAQGFAFIDLTADAPAAAFAAGSELMTRTLDLRETGRIRASAQLRGRTLGTHIVAGQPAAGDEVVWLAP